MRYWLTIFSIGFLPVLVAAQDPFSAETPHIIAASNRERDWRPSPHQQNHVEALARSYFAFRDSGRLNEAYAMFSPGQKSTVSIPRSPRKTSL